MSVMQPAPTVLPKLDRPTLGLSGKDIRKVKEEGEKRDPVAGRSLREDKKEPTTIYVAAKDKRRLRLLAASEGRRVNDYYVAGQRFSGEARRAPAGTVTAFALSRQPLRGAHDLRRRSARP
ncbi:hypothetical protein ACG873_01320 (plasmid) [Mesorhizobium sp. AaZ16]|uniref:hypothetical protein n=1 Tax=Mesorhizobium sp. AaZ16 TaxID=3402289 RepID=UPI00374FC733